MSEDTDERMERATRIRRMREGQRATLASDDDGDSDGPDADEASADDEATSSNVGAADEQATRERTADPDARDDSEGDDEPASDDTADGSGADPNGKRSSGTETDQTDDEATAAAQRAAQAAAQMTSGATGAAAGAEATTGSVGSAETNQPSTEGEPAVPIRGPTGVELPDQESIQAAIADEVPDSDSETAPGPASGRVVAQDAAASEETVRVLEFTLGEEHYCLDIAHVEEIVRRESITRVPNTPDYVEGIVDLRGQITTILDPKRLLDIEAEGSESLLVVFEPDAFEDQGASGWVVDEVRRVVPVADSMVTGAPVDADYVEGVIDRDDEDEFVIWTNPEVAIELATGEREDEDEA